MAALPPRTLIRVLGPVVVDHSANSEPLNPRLRRLLARLAVNRGETVSESAIIDSLWDEGDLPVNPTRSLQTYVSRLRSHLGPGSIERVATGYRLAESVAAVDASQFEGLLDEARQARERGEDRSAAAVLEAALALWQGPALGDLAGERWAVAEAHRLDELRVDADEQRAGLLVGLGDVDGALIARLERLALVHPHREGPTRLLMLALGRVGRQPDALAAFARHRRQLATDLGLEPSVELRQLEARILAGESGEHPGPAHVRTLRGYQIVGRLGEGAFSIVHRAVQPSVDREVAIKQIRAELANQAEFVRRFETEAQLVARLEHPNIVPLYDFWREPDSAYLVMRLLRGGSLQVALRSGPWELARTLTMAGEIGRALSSAHRSGVIHRDVKPANILLDSEGRAFLTDFGIAVDLVGAAAPMAASSIGTAAYAAPEQRLRQPVGPPGDVHGLGLVIYETITGQLPSPGQPIPPVRALRPDLPPLLDDVLARATAPDPGERYQTVDELLEALGQATGAPGEAIGGNGVVRSEARNPYKGLRPFEEGDAHDFAGRGRLVDQLVEAIGTHRLVAVVGPSGSGKSSAVRAGLLPAVRRGRVAGTEHWFVTSLVPGPRPFVELEGALLRIASVRPPDLAAALAAGPDGVAEAVRRVVPDADSQILIVLDQFEELFTLAPPDEAVRFLDALAAAVTREGSQVRVVVTLRADFYDRPLGHEAFGRLLTVATVAVLPLAPDELERAIVDPAQRAGSAFEPGLVSEIVADVSDQPGALPMLQYALTELWEARQSDLLTLAGYRRLGGVSGALARRAEGLFMESDPEAQRLVRRLFGRLVNPAESGASDVRRRVERAELGAGLIDEVIERFGRARLLSFDRDPITREPTVEVAHEALLREWPRLQAWLDEDRDDLRTHRHLTSAASAWATTGRDAGELYRGARLETATEWARAHGSDLNEVEREFLAASEERANQERERERRYVRRLRSALMGLALVAAVAVVAGSLAVIQQRRADGAAAGAETRRLVADAAVLVEHNRDLALLLAVEAHQRQPGPQTLAGLQRVLTGAGAYLGQIGHGESFLAGGWLDDGRIVGVAPDEVRYHDPDSWAVTRTVDLPAPPRRSQYNRVAVDIDGDGVVVGTEDGAVILVEGGAARRLAVGAEPVSVLAYDARRGVIAVGDTAGRVHLIEADSGHERWVAQAVQARSFAEAVGPERWPALAGVASTLALVEDYAFRSGPLFVEILEDGDVLVGAGPHLRRLDAEDGAVGAELLLEQQLIPGEGPLLPRVAKGVTIAPDGRLLVLAGASAMAEVDPQLKSAIWTSVPTGRGAIVLTTSVVLDRAGVPWVGLENGMLARASAGDADPGDPIPVGLATIQSVALDPDGGVLLAAGEGGMVVWSIDGRRLLASAAPRKGNSAAFISADGRQLVASSNQTGVDTVFYDRQGDGWAPRAAPPGLVPTNFVYNDADPLNRWLSAFEPDGTLTRLDRATLEPTGVVDLRAMNEGYSYDGRQRAVITFDHVLTVYDATTNEAVSTVIDLASWAAESDKGAGTPMFDPARPALFVGFPSGTAVVIDTRSWSVDRVITADGDEGGGVIVGTYSRDGSALVTRGVGGRIAVRDPATFALLRTIEGGTSASEAATRDNYISADNEYLVTVRDEAPRLWHLPSGVSIGAFPHDPGVVATGNDLGDELRLVTLVDDHALVWNLDPTTWPAVACQAAGRNLTADEWTQYGPAGEPYRPTCPQWPVPET